MGRKKSVLSVTSRKSKKNPTLIGVMKLSSDAQIPVPGGVLKQPQFKRINKKTFTISYNSDTQQKKKEDSVAGAKKNLRFEKSTLEKYKQENNNNMKKF